MTRIGTERKRILMKCPVCNAKARIQSRSDETEGPVCPECGWGSEVSEVSERTEAIRGVGFYLRYGLMWVLTVIVVAGPYLGIRYLLVEMGEFVETGDALAKLNLHYGWILLAYIGVCWAVTLEYDRSNLGIFGGHPNSKYNPAWTPEQHANRFMRTSSVFLMPGKVVVDTVATTWNLLRKPKS